MSLGHIPPVPRLRLPARRDNPWVRGPWADNGIPDHGGHGRRARRGLILALDHSLFPQELRLGHEAAEALHRLRVQGWRLAVLTSGLPSAQFRKVAALGLTSLVDEIVYAEEHVPGRTAAAAAFTATLAALELAPDRCVCVSDDPARDVPGARAFGMPTVRLARPDVAPAPAGEADVVIDSLQQLPDAAALLLDVVTAGAA